ncbi:MAG: class I SAM-dependent methyltransferase [Alphaproteobacteria bacterium]|nr:class I SAM-dependent methyltransferase [Alphaproteobacteria bacterium]
MSNRTLAMTDAIHAFLVDATLREAPIQAELRRETAALPMAGMQIAPEQGQFMAFLVELLGVRRYLEIGTFTGYSALAVALALPVEGRATCLDRSDEWTQVARRYWQRAGVADRIDLRLGAGRDTLDALLAAGDSDRFDMAFIDADKVNYDAYYERCLKLVRPGGLIALDNMLWGGDVANAAKNDEDTVAIRSLNRKIRNDRRVTCSLVPIGDGMMLCRRRAAATA